LLRKIAGLQLIVRQGVPESLAQMLRKGLRAVGWAGTKPAQSEEQETAAKEKEEEEQKEVDAAAERERELARQLSEMKAIVALSLGRPPPDADPDPEDAQADEPADRAPEEVRKTFFCFTLSDEEQR
jgi:hypothetical protein